MFYVITAIVEGKFSQTRCELSENEAKKLLSENCLITKRNFKSPSITFATTVSPASPSSSTTTTAMHEGESSQVEPPSPSQAFTLTSQLSSSSQVEPRLSNYPEDETLVHPLVAPSSSAAAPEAPLRSKFTI
jgi:hypothetical protein